MNIDALVRATILVEQFGMPAEVAFRGTAKELDHVRDIYVAAWMCGCLGCAVDAFAVGRTALLRYPREGGPWSA